MVRMTRRLMLGAGLAGLAAGPVAAQFTGELPNLFISPAGKPFRALLGAPYPVGDWFKEADRDGNGQIDRFEFLADSEAFFDVLDINKDGILDPYEVSMYEHRVAPEILLVSAPAGVGRLWLAQAGPLGNGYPGETTARGHDTNIDPGGGHPNQPRRRDPAEAFGHGAEPFSLIRAPEPVTSGDSDYLFRGKVRKERFMKRAEQNFAVLDAANAGFLTLDRLPWTPVQALYDRRGGRRR